MPKARLTLSLTCLFLVACKPDSGGSQTAKQSTAPSATTAAPVPTVTTIKECARSIDAEEVVQKQCTAVINSNADDATKAAAFERRAERGWPFANYDAKLSDFNKALELNPSRIASLVGRGSVLYSKKQYAESIRDLTRALEIDPLNASALDDRGDAHRAMKALDKAKADWRKAASIFGTAAEKKSDDVFPLQQRALLYVKLGDYSAALLDYSKALKLKPDGYTFRLRADAFVAAGRYRDAIADAVTATRLGWPGSTISSTLFYAGEYRMAEDVLSALIEIDPKDSTYHRMRGDARLELGQADAALADIFKSIELDPKSASSYDSRADLYWRSGDATRAGADFDRAVELAPEQEFWLRRRGGFLKSSGEHDRAATDFRKAIALITKSLATEPNDAGELTLRAECHDAIGDIEAALTDLTKAIEVDVTHALAFKLRAEILMRNGQQDKARADNASLLALQSGSDAASWQMRAHSNLGLGKHAEALDAIETALERQPNAASYLVVRAQIFEAMGRREEAVSDYRRALSRNKTLSVAVEGLKRLDVK